MLIGDKLNISIISILILSMLRLHRAHKGSWSLLKKMGVKLIVRARKCRNLNCFRLNCRVSPRNRVGKRMVKLNRNMF